MIPYDNTIDGFDSPMRYQVSAEILRISAFFILLGWQAGWQFF